ncbi:hypothetical protein EHS17_08035 [Rhodobacteraceae bacterium CH30]|nr:hypothetical protein EHS17_08035 [Rhodobacteraceae bacterium CH30]
MNIKIPKHLLLFILLIMSSTSRGASQEISQQPPGIGGVVHPNVMWALSVEFPTAGDAYSTERTISQSGQLKNTRIGYFDPGKCYLYDGVASESDSTDWGRKDNGYFYPAANAVKDSDGIMICGGGQWSGSLLNWATMSAVDIFRATLTGGNRALGVSGTVDEYAAGDAEGATYLRRARIVSNQNRSYGFGEWARSFDKSLRSFYPKLTPFSDPGDGVASMQFSSLDWRFSVKYQIKSGKKFVTKYRTYNAVIKVCDPKFLEKNCILYKNGSKIIYKPQGLIQQNSADMRFGAFTYLNEAGNNRDGGALRARMKYTGTATETISGTGKTYQMGAEWSGSTGIFATNPDAQDAMESQNSVSGSVVGNSGVVNVINKFGDASGYKTNDPGAELYYAALRYFRKKGNFDLYTKGLSNSIMDGFPVVTDWDDPIKSSCQKNFIIYIGDTNTHNDVELPGSSWSGRVSARIPTDDSEINVSTWLDKIPGASKVNTGSSNSPSYMAALAYWANISDIRADMRGKQTVQAFTIDTVENGEPKSETTNALYLAAKWGGFSDSNDSGTPDITSEWRDPGSSIADYPTGVPLNFAQANNPTKMVTSLQRAISNVTLSGNTTLVTPTVNGNYIKPDGGTRVYMPSFLASDWSGDLQAYPVSKTGVLSKAPSWSAKAQLESMLNSDPRATNRKIYSYDRSTQQGTTFSSDQKWLLAALGKDETGVTDDYAAQRVSYLRGDRQYEAEAPYFRKRASRLGDIVNSAPAYIGAPAAGRNPQGCSYGSDEAQIRARKSLVAVGANDGMLHVFDASSGNEVFSYVPGAIVPRLNSLMSSNFSHRYFVDGPALVAEACLQSGTDTQAASILLGTTGAGGNALFALDVTKAGNTGFNKDNVLWEFSNEDDSNMGVAVSRPQLVKVRNGTDSNGNLRFRYAVLTGNGLNSSGSMASLYLLYLDGPENNKSWVRGQDYLRLDVAAVTDGDMITPNGLMSPASVDHDQDGITDYVYASDINGRLWKFDLTSSTPSSWAVQAKPFFAAYEMKDGKLFKRQPVIAPPLVIKHPQGGLFVLFGSGKLFSDADRSSGSVQYLYGVRDAMDGNTVSNTNLVGQGQVGETFEGGSGHKYQTTASNTVDYATKSGWFLTLPESERVLSEARITNGRVQFTSQLPSSDPCSAGMETWVTEVLPFSGGQLDKPIFDTNGDGGVNHKDAVSSRYQINAPSGGILNLQAPGYTVRVDGAGGSQFSESKVYRRISWRELISGDQ